MQTKPTCPKCNAPMVQRTNRQNNSQFWGCSKFPACRGTRNFETIVASKPDSYVTRSEYNRILSERQSALQAAQYSLNGKPFNPSQRQLDLLHFVQTQPGNLFVNAYAGTGKSTTCAWIINQLPRSLQIVYFAFNKAIANEFRDKYGLNAMTMHSFGFYCLQQALGNLKVEGNKKSKIAQNYWPTNKSLRKFVTKVASLALNTQTDYNSPEALQVMIDRYGVEVDVSVTDAKDELLNPIPFERILSTVASIIIDSLELVEAEKVVDYDEMLYYPVFADLLPKKWDFIFVDEAQDTNALQIAFVKKTIKDSGRFVFVGDRHQAIYAFRGAMVDAVDNIVNSTNATVLPLDITYRCPQSHIKEMANLIVPGIVAAPQNAEGTIRYIGTEAARQEWKQLDEALIMCRTNAPLVKACLALIKTGKRANIAGRNIGEGLIDLIESMDASNVDQLIVKLEAYQAKEVARLMERDQEEQAELLADRIECILTFCDGQSEVLNVIAKIDNLFTDKRGGTILFSSVHKAKGLEARDCFVIEPTQLNREDIHGQFKNLAYVAVTRSLLNFTFVEGSPNWAKLSGQY